MATLKIVANYGVENVYTSTKQNEQFQIEEQIAKDFMSTDTSKAEATETLIDNFAAGIEGLTNNFYRYCEVTRKTSVIDIIAQ